MGKPFARFRENSKVFLFYLKKYRRYYAIGIGSLVVVDTIDAIPPILMKRVIDGLESIHDAAKLRHLLVVACATYLAIAFVQGYMRYLWRTYIVRTSLLASNDMRQDLFSHLSSLAPGFFKRKRVGELVSLATNDIESVRFALGPGTLVLCDALFYFLVIPPIMISISPRLTLCAFVPMLAVPFFVRRMESVIQRHFKLVQERFSDLAAYCQESMSGIRVIKGAALEPFKQKEMETLGSRYIEANLSSALVQSSVSMALDFFVSTSTTILFLMGGSFVLKEKITIGVFVAFQRYIQKMVWPMEGFGMATNIFQRSLASQKRVDEVMLEKAGILPPKKNLEQYPESDGVVPLIEVCNLSFTYPEKTLPALKNVSFQLKPGMRLGLAGSVGSGKSCLLNCLARMEPIEAGQIFFDGVDITSLPVDYVRRKIGIVPQEVFLFSRSIADNILYGSPLLEAPAGDKQASAKEAAGTANVSKDIDALADRYETMLGERGVNLSGGQKQRISIARALARKPEILLLDDCLSAVDAETERKLIDSLQASAGDRSLIIASHRLSSFDHLDWVLVLEEGRVVEQGSPQDLKKQGTNFSALHKKQEIEALRKDMELVP